MIRPSTFSIVAYDPIESAWGIAVASKFLAVGAVVPWARAQAGAVATQSYANTSYGPKGLNLMQQGLSAEETLQALLAEDAQREQRQVGLVDAKGGTATFTGSECYDWAGGITGEHFAIQGNILTGEKVVYAMAERFTEASEPFHWRLVHALLAGDRAGGDRRGRQSAAIYIVKPEGGYGGFNDRWIDYRVDDHPDPVKRLEDLLELRDLYFEESPPSERVELIGENLREMQKILKAQGYYQAEIREDSQYDLDTRQALRAFIGNENFEERTDFEQGWIDRPVFEYLLRHFGDAS
jgi:uncharacterized Ntn-hydrolase superfamily protein